MHFLGWALLVDVREQAVNVHKHISTKCLTWESCYNLHDDMHIIQLEAGGKK